MVAVKFLDPYEFIYLYRTQHLEWYFFKATNEVEKY